MVRYIFSLVLLFCSTVYGFSTDLLLEGARLEVKRAPIYKSAYYKGGYPPPTEGVCTDLIWRAFKYAGYDLKSNMDEDIKLNTLQYPSVSKPDPNIDFRRVKNQRVFFERHFQVLTNVYNEETRDQWQAGDIVTFKNPDHVVILSDKKDSKGIPFVIHNAGPVPSESDSFMRWYKLGVTGHFRYK